MAAPVDLRPSVASLARDLKSLGIDPPPGFRGAFMRESRPETSVMIGPLAHHPFVFRLSPKGFPKGPSISSERLTESRRFSSCPVS